MDRQVDDPHVVLQSLVTGVGMKEVGVCSCSMPFQDNPVRQGGCTLMSAIKIWLMVLQSLVTGVDMEDLGVRSCSTPFKNIPVEHEDFPDDLKQYVKVQNLQLSLHNSHVNSLLDSVSCSTGALYQ